MKLLKQLNENIRVNDRIFANPEVNETWDKEHPKFERVGKGVYQDSEDGLEIYLFMFKDEKGKIQSTKFKWDKDFMEFVK